MCACVCVCVCRACVCVPCVFRVPCVDVLLLAMPNSEKDLEAMILEVDPNGDGKITWEEFLQIMQQVV